MKINWHKHHIVPRHMGGTNEKRNLIKVNIPMHAFLHKCLWEEHGFWQDETAWKVLSGQISAAEATIEAIKRTQTGRIHSLEEKEKRKKSQTGQKRSDEAKRNISNGLKGKIKHSEERKIIIGNQHRGKKLSEEHKEILRNTHKNKKKSPEQKQKMREARLLWWKKRKEGYSNAQ